MSDAAETVESKAKVYDRSKYKAKNPEYYATFKAKNEAKLKEKHICPVCFGTYGYYSKSTHIKTRMHQRILAGYPQVAELGKNSVKVNTSAL